ncbi:hypothetical protein CIK05_10195 [Bdellovibrio sp. qaytius]|nr:hypothetical protein CIK05_10195 [Bdellovibrio sp. qaytius]
MSLNNITWKKVVLVSVVILAFINGYRVYKRLSQRHKTEISWHIEKVDDLTFNSPYSIAPVNHTQELTPGEQAVVKKTQQYRSVKSGQVGLLIAMTTYVDKFEIHIDRIAKASIQQYAQTLNDPSPGPQFSTIKDKKYHGIFANYKPSTMSNYWIRAAYVQSGQKVYMIVLMIAGNELSEADTVKLFDSIEL